MLRASPKLSSVEREALPSLWATRTKSIRARQPQVDTSAKCSPALTTGTSAFSVASTTSWGGPIGQPTLSPPMPHHFSGYNHARAKSLPHQPLTLDGSQTLRDSERWSKTSGSTIASPRCQWDFEPLPGTMAHRDVAPAPVKRSRPTPATGHQRRQSTRLQRLRVALKHIFVHDSDDDYDVERIETIHWADEGRSPDN